MKHHMMKVVGAVGVIGLPLLCGAARARDVMFFQTVRHVLPSGPSHSTESCRMGCN